MIQEREDKIKKITHTVERRKGNGEQVILDSVKVFNALMDLFNKSQNKLYEELNEKKRAAEMEGKETIKDLEQEITELKRRDTELEQLLHTADQPTPLQLYTFLSPSLTTNCSDICVDSYVSVETVRKALSQLQRSLNEEFTKTVKEIRQPMVSEELKRIHQHKVNVTLDPDTANPFLILSKDGKQVSCGDKKQNRFPFCCDNPKRFDKYIDVLGKKGFSSGRFYFEVQVSGKTDWSLGVVKESVNRKEEIDVKPQNGFWTLILRNGNEYTACAEHPVSLPLRGKPQKVGVFVDYEEGLVSFYDVEARSHIYSYTGQSFTGNLYPLFSPGLNDEGKNSAALIITPVSNTE
uniref:B30.2/SPRY domain-containing protein n=1 Tax=Astyanax mexicanus TaxID=7994 RepID=A0A8B9HUM2_ASTMX